MNNNIGNIGDLIDSAIKEKLNTSTLARLVGYKLPIKAGKMTFSAIDPLGDGSRRAFKTSLVWGQASTNENYSAERLRKSAYITTMKFVPFKIGYNGVITGGGFISDQPKRLACNRCKKEVTVTAKKYTVIKRYKQNFCQACLDKKVNKNNCFLVYVAEVPGEPDKETINDMITQTYEDVTNPLGLVPQVYGVFQHGAAPGSADNIAWLEEEQELVSRYAAIGREVRPLKFLSDLYAEASKNGQKRWKPIPNLEDLVVAGSPVVTQWVAASELRFCPFSKGGRHKAGYACRIPKPPVDLLV